MFLEQVTSALIKLKESSVDFDHAKQFEEVYRKSSHYQKKLEQLEDESILKLFYTNLLSTLRGPFKACEKLNIVIETEKPSGKKRGRKEIDHDKRLKNTVKKGYAQISRQIEDQKYVRDKYLQLLEKRIKKDKARTAEAKYMEEMRSAMRAIYDWYYKIHPNNYACKKC